MAQKKNLWYVFNIVGRDVKWTKTVIPIDRGHMNASTPTKVPQQNIALCDEMINVVHVTCQWL